MRTTKTTKTALKPFQRFQAANRFASPFEEGTEKSVCRRYQITANQLHRAVIDLKNARFTKIKHCWNPAWTHPDVIHHVVDSSIAVDMLNGAPKASDMLLFMDQDFDAVNGMLHAKWTEDDVNTLLAGLPYRVLEMLRDSTPGDECYNEAIEFAQCDLFKAICKRYNLDYEILLISALELTKPDL
jgi:hypothetical protein